MRFSIRFTFALKEGCEIKRLAAAFEKLYILHRHISFLETYYPPLKI